MHMIFQTVIGGILITAVKAQAEPGLSTRSFQGTGRACYGTLTVEPSTISWLTTFSHCQSMSYVLVGQEKQNGQSRMTYRLTSHAEQCRFTILSLTHAGPAPDTGWEVTGYGSEQSYLADKSSGYQAKAEDIMSCFLVRNTENKGCVRVS